jgi:catechol 2,3-dioxygenase-like lactoylglutathione lyase family enzyme
VWGHTAYNYRGKAPNLKKSKIITFVATKKAGAARKFYEETLGLTFVSDDPFAIVFDVNGTMLRVQKVEELVLAGHTVLGWEVADIRAEIEQLTKRGVRFERFEGMGQDELGVWTSPAGGKIAWFKDPDGNTLSFTQFAKGK